MTQQNLALNDQVALVTGASSGLGRAAAVELAQAGAKVVLLARSNDGLQQVATELGSHGWHSLPFPGDLADEHYILNAVQRTIEA